MREWFVFPGRELRYCPYCGNELVYRSRRGSKRLKNPDHGLCEKNRKLIGGVEYAFDKYVCHGGSET